ncbi:S-adenosyl-L-methionine-dependent methyltransferase [Peziza echinospora]|nr:S-adenosyl-L-methionine-dependent methyltransferase [Peziza echinospora]
MAEASTGHENLPAIEVQDDDYEDYDDSGSDYASGTASDTTSLSSSITRYQYENGRRYHAYKEGTYAFPNDEAEQDRLDLYHHIWRLRFGGALYLAPLDKGIHKALDIGTGTGIWATDFADEFESAEVIGTDISPIQPRWVPPNVKFEVDDCEAQWTFPKNSFDFIHGRNLGGSISDWPKLFDQIYKHLAPGGIVEMKDINTNFFSDDNSLKPDDPISEWQDNCNTAAERIGRLIAAGPLLKSHLTLAGFEDVTETVVKTPLGMWPSDPKEKEIGMYMREMMVEGVDGLSIGLFTRILGWSPEKTLTFTAEVKKSFKNKRNHIYTNWYVVHARKPLTKAPATAVPGPSVVSAPVTAPAAGPSGTTELTPAATSTE